MAKRMVILLYEGEGSTPLDLFLEEGEEKFLLKSDSVTYNGIKFKINEFVFDFSNDKYSGMNTVSLYCERI